jgi:hypothetical protein
MLEINGLKRKSLAAIFTLSVYHARGAWRRVIGAGKASLGLSGKSRSAGGVTK